MKLAQRATAGDVLAQVAAYNFQASLQWHDQ